MKKQLSILFFLVCSFTATLSFGQARIGSTEYEIKSDFPDKTFERGYTDKDVKWISFKGLLGLTIYYCDENGKCNLCALFPNDQKTLNILAEKYNKEYVIISDTKWKMYSAGGVMYIDLKLEDDGYYFIYY